MKVTLKDGTIVSLRWQSVNPKKEDPKKFLNFINPIIREGAYILMDKPTTLEAEKKWVEDGCKRIKHGELIRLIAEKGGRIVGTCDARRGKFKEKGNVTFGIAIAKEMRRKELGNIMLTTVIKKLNRNGSQRTLQLVILEATLQLKGYTQK